jgi:hypothetical protein
MMVNFLLIISVILNFCLLVKYTHLKNKQFVPSDFIDPDFLKGHAGLQSISDPDKTVLDRYDRILKQYTLDKQQDDTIHYDSNREKINKEWYSYCISRLKKITSIESRMDQYAVTLNYLASGSYEESRTDIHEKTEVEKEYDVTMKDISNLNDIENYYAKFISNETYKSIKKSAD